MGNWYANPVAQVGGEWKAHDMTTQFVSGSEIKYWTGSVWTLKPIKNWVASEWLQKLTKRWTGSAWLEI